jgi:translation initiation factor IF-1
MARKNEIQTYSSKTRLSHEEDEVYAIVTKALGNCMFHVKTITGIDKLLLHIRGKFSGRNKRQNFISCGTFVLIGLRDYEKPNYKECDLLEIYGDQDVKKLMTLPSIQNNRFFTQTVGESESVVKGKITEDDIIFSSKTTDDDEIVQTKTKLETVDEMEDDDEINIDDI